MNAGERCFVKWVSLIFVAWSVAWDLRFEVGAASRLVSILCRDGMGRVVTVVESLVYWWVGTD